MENGDVIRILAPEEFGAVFITFNEGSMDYGTLEINDGETSFALKSGNYISLVISRVSNSIFVSSYHKSNGSDSYEILDFGGDTEPCYMELQKASSTMVLSYTMKIATFTK